MTHKKIKKTTAAKKRKHNHSFLSDIKNKWSRLDSYAQKRTRHIGISADKENFIENLAMLLEAGMDILGVLEAIKLEVKSKSMKLIIEDLKTDIEGGSPLWQALEASELFSPYAIALIRTGEESGNLDQNLKSIVIQQKKEQKFKTKVRSAMTYPLLVLGITLIIGIGISWFILPRLATVFDQLNLKLPLVTRLLIDFGSFLGEYGSFAVPSFLLILLLTFYFTFFFTKTKFIGQKILLNLPIISKLIHQVEISRFGYTLGTLLQAGLSIEDSMDSLRYTTGFPSYQRFYKILKEGLLEGKSFQDVFESTPSAKSVIPQSVQQMINAAYFSGNLSDILVQIGERYESKTENTTKSLSVALEPILLVIVWLGVVFLALAVILPIYNLVGGFNANPI